MTTKSFAMAFALIYGFASSVCMSQQIMIAPLQVAETGEITTDVFTKAEDSELRSLFQPKQRPETLLTGIRLLQDDAIRESLGISKKQIQTIRAAQARLTKTTREKLLKELNEFSAMRDQLIKNGADDKEVKQFMSAELQKMHKKLGNANRDGLNSEVVNVLSKDQVASLDSLKERILLIQAGLDSYLTNQRVVDQVFESESRKKKAINRINELSDKFDDELRKLKLKYQKEMIDSLNNKEKETVADLLELSISELKSELIGRSMLLKNVEE